MWLSNDKRGKRQRADQSDGPPTHICNYPRCGIACATHYKLTRHKNETAHNVPEEERENDKLERLNYVQYMSELS